MKKIRRIKNLVCLVVNNGYNFGIIDSLINLFGLFCVILWRVIFLVLYFYLILSVKILY